MCACGVCACVCTCNSAGLRTALASLLSHRELRSSLRESYSFLSLPADTTKASSQGTSVSSNSFSRWTTPDIFLFQYHFLLHILLFLFFFSENIMADVGSKQQTSASFLSHHSHTHKKTHRTEQKTDKPDGKPLPCQRTSNLVLRAFIYAVKLHSLTWIVWGSLKAHNT
jgi:hypothetical protein